MDEIIIKGLKMYAYHGVNPEEKHNGQNFYVDVVAHVDISKPCQTDNVNDTVSYSKMAKTIQRVFMSRKYNLLEKAAQVTADALLNEYPEIVDLSVTVKKPEAPMKAEFEYVGVKIFRSRT